MKNITLSRFAIVSTFISLAFTSAALGQVRSSRVSTMQTGNLIARLESKTDIFKRAVDASLDRSPINNTNREDRIIEFITEFENATDSLRRNFNARRAVGADVQEVLNRALFIDRFMSRSRMSVQATNQWASIRTDLNSLARYNNVAWNWTRSPRYPDAGDTGNFPGRGFPARGFDARLTGTYRLNHSQSDDVNTILDRWDDVYTTEQRDRARNNLSRRLTPPELLVIEKAGRNLTLASSLASQVSLQADGVARTERTRSGRTIRTTVSANNDSLLISYEGDRMNDFYLTFQPGRDGQLRVTRKLYLENRSETVSVTSVYDKTNAVADWSTVNTGVDTRTGTTGTTSRDFVIPNGTRLNAQLATVLNTGVSQPGDRFTMEVTSPVSYRGAIIEGRIASAERSGRVSGRASLSLEFDTIRMPDGNTYRFAGIIDSVRSINGDTVRVNNEGTVRDGSQTTRTATRAGVGAALGALIGAIAGGGSGAAIGAAVGAGAGAGTVFIQGRDSIELAPGTEFSITATAPNNAGYRSN